jgi:hypothetical protein
MLPSGVSLSHVTMLGNFKPLNIVFLHIVY